MPAGSAERALLERLSIFSGGFTLEAAQTVCTDATIHNAEVPRLLARLVERSLVKRCRLADVERYRVPEPLRAAASERLTACGQAGKFRLRLVDHLLALAQQGDGCLTQGGEGAYGWEWGVPVGAEGTAWLNRQEQELDNVHCALRWLTEQGEIRRGLDLAGSLLDYWQTGPERLEAGHTWLTQLMAGHPASVDATPTLAERAVALHHAANLTFDAEIARDLFEEALAIYQELGHPGQIIHLAGHVVNTMCSMRDYTAARALLHNQLEGARARGKYRLVSRLVDRLAQVAYDEGDLVTARSHFEEALALCQGSGNAVLLPHVLLGLARAAGAQHDVHPAETIYRQTLTLFAADDETAAANTWPLVLALEGLASVTARLGEVERAGRLFGAADGERERLRTAVPSAGEPIHDRYVLQARATLHGNRYEGARAEGRAMSLEQAIAYALAETS